MSTLFEQFRTRAEAVGAEVHRFLDAAAARDFVLEFVQTEGSDAVWASGPLLGNHDFPVTRDRAASAVVGVTEMQAAIAATGTLVTDGTAVERRLAATLPPIHIAIVATETIVPDMATAFQRIHPRNAPYISLITGPSRTADIERVLTIGVHGPKRLIVVCVDGQRNN